MTEPTKWTLTGFLEQAAELNAYGYIQDGTLALLGTEVATGLSLIVSDALDAQDLEAQLDDDMEADEDSMDAEDGAEVDTPDGMGNVESITVNYR
jgi:hypothetical protein